MTDSDRRAWLEDSMELDTGEEAGGEGVTGAASLQLNHEDNVDTTNCSFLRSVVRTQSSMGGPEMEQEQHQLLLDSSAESENGPKLPLDPINASFDMSLLNRNRDCDPQNNTNLLQNSPFRQPPILRAATSWDEHETSSSKKRSASKQNRAHFAELPHHPRKVRLNEGGTPLRPRFRAINKKSVGKLTPASAKRHRAPLRRSSPHHHHHRTPRAEARFKEASATTPHDTSGISSFNCQQQQQQQQQEQQQWNNSYEPATAVKRKPKRSLGTCTTAASSTAFENILDSSDSVEENSNFRFTSFPASLPRIQNAPARTNHGDSGDGTQNTSLLSSLAAHDNLGYSDDDDHDDDHDDDSSSILGTPVTRTRLNFNAATSPLAMESRMLDDNNLDGDDLAMEHDDGDVEDKVDLSRPYEQQRISSFASSVSSITKNLSGCDDVHTHSTAGLTPSRTSGLAEASSGQQDPGTPREVQLHFQLDAAQCSPIPGIPEEEGDSSTKSGSKKQLRPHLRFSSSTGSASTGSRGRPMPDMNAFDGNNNNASHSSGSTRSAVDESGSLYPPSSPKLLCPPTPVRTPAWAHSESKGHPIFKAGPGHQKYARSNSLIATKVLATCSPHVLDGRASLENSVLEEGKSGSTTSEVGSTDINSKKETDNSDLDWLHHVQSPSQALDPRVMSTSNTGPVVSLANSFDVISTLGSGTFADVYKVRSKADGRLYAIKRNRRQFRGKRDREAALSEVRSMQRLQSHVGSPSFKDNSEKANYSLYLLFFFQAWQEDGHFFCQTELCCRDTCREMMDALRSKWNVAKTRYPSLQLLPASNGVVVGSESDVEGRLMPDNVILKICHDIGAGLSHIHSCGLVHNDIKASNILFEKHGRFGALCKIGDFGMARDIGSSEDGQEGDQKYMALELLESGTIHPSADIFSLGLTLYEMASNLHFVVPSEGPRWHEVRSGNLALDIPAGRSAELVELIRLMISPRCEKRPSADTILSSNAVSAAGKSLNTFLRDYIHDVEEFDKREEEKAVFDCNEDETPRHAPRRLCSPPPYTKLPVAPLMLYSSPPAPT